MSFNKEQHLRANIEALKLCFLLEKENRNPTAEETKALKQFSGFGALKCILNPVENLSDIARWPDSEVGLFPAVMELHDVLKRNSKTAQQYKLFTNSLKNSILSAFYTPPEIVNTISEAFKNNQLEVSRFLDPSAGLGEFISAFKSQNDIQTTIGFEKDLLTGKILSQLYPDDKIQIKGFEEIESRHNNYFDVVSSNIPFGDVAAFDISHLKSPDRVKQQASRSIHNYFFLKGVYAIKDGGVLAFITSQGVMNSTKNEPIRRYLMENTNLVSAIRLPNNLFKDYAGTEVGSDLVILQKDNQKGKQTQQEQAFVESEKYSSGVYNNTYFNDLQRVVHTKGYIDTDPYGKPAQIFIHGGGIPGIAGDLKKMLESDLRTRLNLELFQKVNTNKTAVGFSKNSPTREPSKEQAPQNLYDLFGFSQEERTQRNTIRRQKQTKTKSKQLNLFNPPGKVNGTIKNNKIPTLPNERNYSGELRAHYKKGSLVKDNNQLGYLKEWNESGGTFKRLSLSSQQETKAFLFIQLRDVYQKLYQIEADTQQEDKGSRHLLNKHYDEFVRNYGQLNDPKNLGLIKMDPLANEVLALERGVNGELVKTDIFTQPVAFNAHELDQVDT
ncbi:MAG TPA: N-6 DNA methylase, partial [Draconibacterium sp.]|nr:N-6 DNA methylase [Draconibacterium sp.]